VLAIALAFVHGIGLARAGNRDAGYSTDVRIHDPR